MDPQDQKRPKMLPTVQSLDRQRHLYPQNQIFQDHLASGHMMSMPPMRWDEIAKTTCFNLFQFENSCSA